MHQTIGHKTDYCCMCDKPLDGIKAFYADTGYMYCEDCKPKD